MHFPDLRWYTLVIAGWSTFSVVVGTVIAISTYTSNDNEMIDFKDHVKVCVVAGQCPNADNRLHVLRERFCWFLISHFGAPGTFLALLLTGILFTFMIPAILAYGIATNKNLI